MGARLRAPNDFEIERLTFLQLCRRPNTARRLVHRYLRGRRPLCAHRSVLYYALMIGLVHALLLTPSSPSDAFYWIPNAALSAVIIHAVLDLIASPRQVYAFWKCSPLECLIFILAVLVSVFSYVLAQRVCFEHSEIGSLADYLRTWVIQDDRDRHLHLCRCFCRALALPHRSTSRSLLGSRSHPPRCCQPAIVRGCAGRIRRRQLAGPIDVAAAPARRS